MTHNLVVIADNVLRSTFVGDVNEKVVTTEFAKNIAPYLEKATPDTPLHFLVEAGQEGKFSGAARRMFTSIFKDDPRLGKVAIINVSRSTRVMATFLIKATERIDTVKFFEVEEEALVWLKE